MSDDLITDASALFDSLMKAQEYEAACALAMETSERLLDESSEATRSKLFETYFRRLDQGYLTQYQSYDFEICDYQMFSLSASRVLFRGPKPGTLQLSRGRYLTIFGAAQLFGRFHAEPFHVMVQRELALPVLNLSMGGAGPELFLNEDFIKIANRGCAVVLQVLSGRSVGCDEYPGMRTTARAGSGDAPRDRIKLLKSIWEDDRLEAARLVDKWQLAYVREMRRLIGSLCVPVFLVWVSNRKPSDWSAECVPNFPDFGSFPQLVTRAMVDELASVANSYTELSPDPEPKFSLASRVTGKPCPFFGPNGEQQWINNYYPSIVPHEELFVRLRPSLVALP